MKIFNSQNILSAVQTGRIEIDPFNADNLKPASYILKLNNRWRTWKSVEIPIDLFDKKNTDELLSDTIIKSSFILDRGGFCLAATRERIRLPSDIAAFIFPISHIARYGLSVNLGTSFISPGFGGVTATALTLEIASHCPSKVLLRSGCPIAHLIFIKVSDGTILNERIRSVFEGINAPSSPAIWEEWELEDENMK